MVFENFSILNVYIGIEDEIVWAADMGDKEASDLNDE